MDTQPGNRATPDSLRRKRDIPDSKHDESGKRRDTRTSDDIYQTDMAATETTDDTIHAAGTKLSSQSTITNFHDTDITSISSDTNTASDDQTKELNEAPPKPSLQTIPRGDSIYEHLAATEKRIVLGRRMVEAGKSDSTDDLDDYFNQAVALHPLSMTCRQFRDEFQDIHTEASEPQWTLLVNNLDLEQLRAFSDNIQVDEYIIVSNWTTTHRDPLQDYAIMCTSKTTQALHRTV